MLWKLALFYLRRKKLSRDERVDLLNYFNKEMNAFPVSDSVRIKTDGMILANGRQMTLEQREVFLQGARSLLGNSAFNLIADQVVYQAMRKGLHDSNDFDSTYFSKTALYFIDLFRKYLETLGKLA